MRFVVSKHKTASVTLATDAFLQLYALAPVDGTYYPAAAVNWRPVGDSIVVVAASTQEYSNLYSIAEALGGGLPGRDQAGPRQPAGLLTVRGRPVRLGVHLPSSRGISPGFAVVRGRVARDDRSGSPKHLRQQPRVDQIPKDFAASCDLSRRRVTRRRILDHMCSQDTPCAGQPFFDKVSKDRGGEDREPVVLRSDNAVFRDLRL